MKFPTVHIATSTVNRILNVADEIDSKGAPVMPVPTPPPPMPADPTLEGTLLNSQLLQPAQPAMAPDQDTANALALKGLM